MSSINHQDQDALIQPILDNFLDRINYNNIYTYLIPYNNHSKELTGKDLLKWNVKREARRLRITNSQGLINLTVDNIWKRSKPSQRDRFTNLASDMNKNYDRVSLIRLINNTDTLDRIARIDIPQVTNDPFECALFNGTDFGNNNNPDNDNLTLSAADYFLGSPFSP